jgi:glycosyltransferase involved in cell wall biosynthesis
LGASAGFISGRDKFEMDPLVSVIIPAYNAQDFIARAIESVLAQEYERLEVLVVDDGSCDGTPEICNKYAAHDTRVRVLRHADEGNKGPSRSRELALRNALGEYVAFCDADDEMWRGRIRQQLSAFERYPESILVHSRVQTITDDDRMADFLDRWFDQGEQEKIYQFLGRNCLREDHICNSTIMVRRPALDSIRFSFQQKYQHEDWLMLILLAQHGPFIYIPQQLTRYRYYRNSATYQFINNPGAREFARLEMYRVLWQRLQPGMWAIRGGIVVESIFSVYHISVYHALRFVRELGRFLSGKSV